MIASAVAPIGSEQSMTANKLTRLVQLTQEGQGSTLIKRTVDKLFAHEIAESRTQLAQLVADP